MDDPDPGGALGAGLFQSVGQQLLADQLVEGFVEDEVKRQQVVAYRPVRVREAAPYLWKRTASFAGSGRRAG